MLPQSSSTLAAKLDGISQKHPCPRLRRLLLFVNVACLCLSLLKAEVMAVVQLGTELYILMDCLAHCRPIFSAMNPEGGKKKNVSEAKTQLSVRAEVTLITLVVGFAGFLQPSCRFYLLFW